MLIDQTYFIGEINIAQVSFGPVLEALNLFIGKRETEYLELVLGIDFSELFAAGLAAGTVEARWTELNEGTTFTGSDGVKKRWPGFTNDKKVTPIANYTYYWYIRDGVTFTSGVGEMEGKSDNAKTASPDTKLYSAWNEMVKQTNLLHEFLQYKKDDEGVLVYDEFDIDQAKCFKCVTINGL